VRQVLTALARRGALTALPNRGWFVSPNTTYSEGPSTLRSFSLDVRRRGLTPTSKIIIQQVRPASLDEAEVLAIPPTAPVLELQRLRGMNGVPVGVALALIPLHLVPGLETADLTDRSLFETLSERYGLIASKCDYELRAASATEEIAAFLNLEPGAPVLIGAEITYDQNERPLLTGQTTYRGDAYRFRTSLFTSDAFGASRRDLQK
jgi:GntR family transcriptional regulator